MQHLVGGISSAGRALPSQDGRSFHVIRSQGPYVWDQSRKRYIDTALGFGSTMLGHAHPVVVEAVKKALIDGPSPAFAHAGEEAAAEALATTTRHLSRVVFTNSGSEAVHLACRLARVVTGRSKIAKIAAGYDGWYDEVAFGNVGATEAEMRSNKRPDRHRMLLLRFNDFDDVDQLFEECRDVAAIIIEPMLANAGCLLPDSGYLEYVEAVARRNGALIILDEVLMGFRLGFGLTGHMLGMKADLAAVGKAIGSGIAVAAVVGTPEAMSACEDGRALRAGTYSGNPLATSAVTATLEVLRDQDYAQLLARGDKIRSTVEKSLAAFGLTGGTTGFGTVFTIWPQGLLPSTYDQATNVAEPSFSLSLHYDLRRRGILVMPSPYGRLYLSFAHSDEVAAELSAGMESAISTIQLHT